MDKIYNDALSTATIRSQQPEADISKIDFAKKFEDTKGNSYFTENPPETAHYDKANDGQGVDFLENTGRASMDKSEGAKAVWGSLGREKIKIDPNEPWFAKSGEIIKNAAAITTGVSSEPSGVVKEGSPAGVNCKESKICRVDYIKKTCNETVRETLLKKTCKKTPKTSASVERTVYPNCQQLVITQDVNTYCPAGYTQILSSDMVAKSGTSWDDIRFCTRPVPIGENAECYSAGYRILNYYGDSGSGEAIIPKKMKARIRISKVYHEYVVGTIVNESTGETIRNRTNFTDGQVIELPYSETKDQKIKFHFEPQCSIVFLSKYCRVGVMVLYVDHIHEEKVAKLEGWTEADCSES